MTERSVIPSPESGITLGQQQLDASDIVPPRVKIVQQMSDEAQGGKTAIAHPGDFFNTLTSEVYGPELAIIPIITFKQRVFLVRRERRERADEALTGAGLEPLSEGDGLKCRSFDMMQGIGEPGIECHICPLSQWDGNTPPICSETYNVAGLKADTGDLIILSFSKSSAKAGKRFFSMIRMSTVTPWAKVYGVKTRSEKNDLGTFFVPDVAPIPEAVAPELLRQAEYWNRELGGRTTIEVTPDDEEVLTDTKDF